MTERVVYARAHPEKIRLTERYYSTQEISRNSTVRFGQEPKGEIEIIVPYDGHQYFTRHAGNDVEQQLNEDPLPDHVDAQIGHLLLADYGQTDLGQLLDLDDHWGSVPLCVPVVSGEVDRADKLCDDRHSCKIIYEYQPDQPQVMALKVSIITRDENISDILEQDQFEDADSQQLEVLFQQIVGQINQRRVLHLIATVQLSIPDTCTPASLRSPMIKSMGLEWPTFPSVRSLTFHAEAPVKPYLEGPALRPVSTVIYNPEKGRVEWANIPLDKKEGFSGSDLQTYSSWTMRLWIQQPGELYKKNMLEGHVELEIPDYLLSGLKVQVADCTGQVQVEPQLVLTTKITHNFQLFLDDIFIQCPRALYQRLHFEDVIPEDLRIADIRAALIDRGFQITREHNLMHSDEALQYLILARRAEGPDMLRLWVFVAGKRYPAEREAQVPGGMTFVSTFESGELEIYMRGDLAGNSQRLTQQMNMVQMALRDRFAYLRARR